MTRINFVTVVDNNLGSHYMRIQIPHDTLNTYQPGWSATISPEIDLDADFNVFSKHFNIAYDANAILATHGGKKVFDVCDNHFEHPEKGPYYEFMTKSADIVTCNTDRMQEVIYETTGVLASIIADPITFPYGSPDELNFKDPKLLWFGNFANIMTLAPIINKVPNLTIITNGTITTPLPKTITQRTWRFGLLQKIIEGFDIVLLPKNHEPNTFTKSPNRAVDAIHAGKFVITDFPEVYGELRGFVFTGSVEDGLKFYCENPAKVKEMIVRGQEYILSRYTHKHIHDQWVTALTRKF